jgi:hypothetical protein
MIHNICCDLYLDVEYGISQRLVYPNLPMIKYRNIIFHIYHKGMLLGLCVKPLLQYLIISPPCFHKECICEKMALLW